MRFELILVDLQNDFASEGGRYYTEYPAVQFLTTRLFPYLEENELRINEVISDYRQPRPGDRGDCCHPGAWGYQSLLPDQLRKSQWVKCMNSPLWVRESIGDSTQAPGLPYQDVAGFQKWLKVNLGDPSGVTPVVMGLTLDCCVLSMVQELSWHGYAPLILSEGVDHASGDPADKEQVLRTPIVNWAKPIKWGELKGEL